ncbi:MarR family winged helix-turn-helix transcriptional regulator [Thalassococcus sp. S3]|uniref:MarR family winged helix-turn-helix transcriptional regulator n=1 Tax=Thalassococcus sp. S3 TaxID=2017482 RepID=UPI0010241E68|nr:MarR family transcriptional regulator [Thalassococcus sp. S3]QBF33029.1 MarR family transcriptional regulator [Thalassococcus sp. S3]
MQDHQETSIDYRLHARLGFRLSRLSRLVQTRLEQKLDSYGMTRLKWCVLSGVALEAVTTPSSLAAHIGLTRPSVSRLLMQMRKEGLIRQDLDEEDGRSRHITLTELGQERLRQCRPIVDENEQYFMKKLATDKAAAFSEGLDTLLSGENMRLDRL